MNKVLTTILFLGMVVSISATDHVMQATKAVDSRETKVDSQLSLSLKEAQDYAVQQNRTLRNASLAVQEAYASRWQTIASMLPQVEANASYTDYCKYSATMEMMGNAINISMPNVAAFNLTASVGINGQAVVGVLLNNIAIDMKKIAFEQNEIELRGNVISAYVTVLALQGLSALLDSSLVNIEGLYAMTQRSVEVGAAEQTTADLIKVRVNAMKNSIETQQNGISLATNALKVLLNVPVETQITLTDELKDLLSAEHILNLLGDNFNIANNLNYQLLEKNTELAKRNVAMAGWAYGPTVSLAYQYTHQHYFEEGGFRMTPPNLVAVTLSVPLWSSGKRAAGVVEKKIAYEEAKNTLSETTANLGIQHQQLCNNLTTTYRTYLNQVENLEVSGRVFNNMANKFRYGVASNMELVNASNDLITAQSGYVNAVLDLVNAQVELEKFLNN
ncbi:MAG: TolC family protein [Paludibacteraceae bacterium]|nr:TolC family protein [Paludibacteraceae bacterium]